MDLLPSEVKASDDVRTLWRTVNALRACLAGQQAISAQLRSETEALRRMLGGGGGAVDVAIWAPGTNEDPASYEEGQIRTIPGLSANCGTYVCVADHESTDTTPYEPSTSTDQWFLLP
jgi:hypothetical protein